MKLYVVKVSPCCRAVWLYCLRNKLPVEIIELDLFAGKFKLCFPIREDANDLITEQ